MADSKYLLKEARKCIDRRDYKTAQACCRKILKKNENNYLALVLLGKSLEKSDDAITAYHKAIECEPEKILAWRGLANFYENRNDDPSKFKLLLIYEQLLVMQIDDDRASNIIVKLGQLGLTYKDVRSINILLKYLGTNPKVKLFKIAESQLLKLIISDIVSTKEDIIKIIGYLSRRILEGSPESLCLVLGHLILKKHRLDKALEVLTRFIFFDSNIVFRKWLCKYLCIHFLKHESFCGIDMYIYREKIVHCIEKFLYARLLISMICYDKGLFLEAHEISYSIISFNEINVIVVTHLLRCTVKLRKWQLTERIAKQCIMRIQDGNFTSEMKKYLLSALAEQRKWAQAIEIGEAIPLDDLHLSQRATLAKCYVENNQPFDDILQTLEDTEYHIQIRALFLIKQQKHMDAIALLLNHASNAVNCFYIAKSYWELNNYELCFIYLSNGVHIDPDNAELNNLLGKYYKEITNNMLLAREFFETAHRLNCSDPDIIKNLSDLYIALQLKKENYYLLKTACNDAPDQSWIKNRLGAHFLDSGMWDCAISLYEHVLTYDKDNVDAHDNLADAYYNKGDFPSALAIYAKTLRLNPSRRAYSFSKIGTIYTLLRQYFDAITAFEHALEIDPEHVSAIKGITVSWMKIAKAYADAKVYQVARDSAQTSINYLITALSGPGKINHYWKLLACSLLFITKLPDAQSFVNINFDDGEIGRLGTIFVKMNIYRLAYYCFWRGQSYLPPHYERRLALEVVSEILEEESAADFFRYCCPPEVGLSYTDWVRRFERDETPFSL